MKLGMMSLLLAFLATSIFAAKPKVIYGEDNRLDIYQVENELHYELARSTAAMIPGSSIRVNGDIATITGRTMQERGMCAKERFSQQMTAANCSGFLVGEDLLVTAGHCITGASRCSSYKWVFGYGVEEESLSAATSFEVKKEDVYSCKSIISRSLDRSSKNDYALIKLDRKVTNRRVLDVRTSGKVETNTEIVVIGHPTGLPTKVAAGAQVKKNGNKIYFQANLDTYGGNSGSAVFNAKTGVVEGILVRGERDYVSSSENGRSCKVSNLCRDDLGNCRGEDVTRITVIKELADLVSK